MDRTDQNILALLTRDGRMSYTELGKACGLSISAAQQRVRRLEHRGIIAGYRVEIDPEKLGKTLKALISVRVPSSDQDETVLKFLQDSPEIVSCFAVAGDATYITEALVASTTELDSLVNRLRAITSVQTVTSVVLSAKFVGRSFLDEPEAE
jgi:Lrp/AsnC family leucine-responsive transcriptional regulator